MSSLTAKLDLAHPNYADVTLTGDEGDIISKKVELKALVEMLDRTCDTRDKGRLIPRLPEGTLEVKWVDDMNYCIEIYVKGDVHPLSFLKKENTALVPYPNLLFMIQVEKGKMTSSRVFAVKDKYRAVNGSTVLYRFPYGNVYVDGRICWGGNSGVFNVPTVTGLEVVIQVFFDAIMNLDLYNFNTKRPISLEQLLAEVAGMEQFDTDILIGLGNLSEFRKKGK